MNFESLGTNTEFMQPFSFDTAYILFAIGKPQCYIIPLNNQSIHHITQVAFKLEASSSFGESFFSHLFLPEFSGWFVTVLSGFVTAL